MSTASAQRHLPRLDAISLLMALLGIFAHGGMLLLDAGLLSAASEAWATSRTEGQVLAGALLAVVALHLGILGWCGRRVAEYAEVLGDSHLATFTRRSRARAAARRAASALFASSGLVPVLVLVTVLLPDLLP